MIPLVANKRVAYHHHVLLDVMIELLYMIIIFGGMLLKLRLYYIQCVYVPIREYQE